MNGTPHRISGRFLTACLLVLALTSQAKIGVEYQMQLGDPSDAKPDTNNHEHYLVQRQVFALDYDDKNGEPNWVSWDLTAEDIGPAKRSPAFHPDNELPASPPIFMLEKCSNQSYSSFGIMIKENLHNYISLMIERDGEIDIAALTYSAADHKFIALLRPGGISETIQPEQLQLTDEMIGEIMIQSDGTLKLVLARDSFSRNHRRNL